MVSSSDKVAVLAFTQAEWATVSDNMLSFARDWFRVNVREAPATKATRRLCLISTRRDIVAFGLVTALGRSGDLDTQVRMTDVMKLRQAITTQGMMSSLSPATLRWAAPVLAGGGILPPLTAADVLNAASADSDEARRAIESLRARIGARRSALDADDQQLIEEQRDAVALGLELAGLDSRQLVPSADAQTELAPFLRTVREGATGTSEASTIRHDAAHFADWIPQDGIIHDVIEFYDPANSAKRVTVLYADKERQERVTGTDLVYYRAHHPGYILVQYKRMRHDPDAPSGKRWSYRPDKYLHEEIKRMRGLKVSAGAEKSDQWRLSPDPFYVKLVEDRRARPTGERLAPGMYLPLGFFEILLENPKIRGPRGGRAIGWHNADRWLSNTKFIELMIDGWIGSTGPMTDNLTELLALTLQADRGAVIVRDDSDS